MQSNKAYAIAGALLALAVLLGAFGAHALKDLLTSERLTTWETAVQYHIWNSLGLLMVALIQDVKKVKLNWPFGFLLAGIFIFSGSLYILCITDIGWLGAITPIGGLSFIAGWSMFTWKMWNFDKPQASSAT